MPTVRITRAGAVETEVPLEARDLRVGRGSDNDIALQDPDKTLSRHHAELRRDGDRWFYLDLNSANGSWVGDRRVTREDLIPGVAIALGDYQLTLVDHAAALDDTADDADATRVVRDEDATLRPVAAAPPSRVATVRAPAAAPPVVGGAVSVGAAARPSPPASSPVFRRIIIYGSIVVFGAVAVMLAVLFRSDGAAPAAETAAAPTSEAAPVPPAPTPVPTTPAPATQAPAAGAPVAAIVPPASAVAPPARPSRVARPAPPADPATRSAPRAAPQRAAVRPRPIRDTDPDAVTIPARQGEAQPALQQRRDDIRRRYELALQRLSARQFVEARDLLAGVSSEAPGFRDLTARMAEADAGLRQQAADGFKAAARLEESAEWTEALRGYERLRPFAASLPGLAEAVERTRKRMHEAGAEALTRARQYDSRGRVPEAIAWYQRAVNWLPPDHPGLEAARQRLAQLVNRP